MKSLRFFLLILLPAFSFSSWKPLQQGWISERQKGYTLVYTSSDKDNRQAYSRFIEKGMKSTRSFFNSPFSREFSVFIHPSRRSLDSTWQKDWGMPDFRSECWMVASGIANRMDIISPKRWDKEACEHSYSDAIHTQQLITHELVHIFHGQMNVSPDFSNVERVDWFVEGLATYASGQLDSARIGEIKQAIAGNKIPSSLDNFWTGKLKYALSGSVVKYIDHHYGREWLKQLLPFNKKSEILSALGISEPDLLDAWKKYVEAL